MALNDSDRFVINDGTVSQTITFAEFKDGTVLNDSDKFLVNDGVKTETITWLEIQDELGPKGTVNTPTVLKPKDGAGSGDTRYLKSDQIIEVEDLGGGQTKLTLNDSTDLSDIESVGGEIWMTDGTGAPGPYSQTPYTLTTSQVIDVSDGAPTKYSTRYYNSTQLSFGDDPATMLDLATAIVGDTDLNIGDPMTTSNYVSFFELDSPGTVRIGRPAGCLENGQFASVMYGSNTGAAGDWVKVDRTTGRCCQSLQVFQYYAFWLTDPGDELLVTQHNSYAVFEAENAVKLTFADPNPDLRYFLPGDVVGNDGLEDITVVSTGYPTENTMTVSGGTWNNGDVVEYETDGGKGTIDSVNVSNKTITLTNSANRNERWIGENKAGTLFSAAGPSVVDAPLLTTDVELESSQFATTPDGIDGLKEIVWNIDGVDQSAGTLNPYRPTGLPVNSEVTIKVKHIANSIGESGWSASTKFTTGATRNLYTFYEERITALVTRIEELEGGA